MHNSQSVLVCIDSYMQTVCFTSIWVQHEAFAPHHKFSLLCRFKTAKDAILAEVKVAVNASASLKSHVQYHRHHNLVMGLGFRVYKKALLVIDRSVHAWSNMERLHKAAAKSPLKLSQIYTPVHSQEECLCKAPMHQA